MTTILNPGDIVKGKYGSSTVLELHERVEDAYCGLARIYFKTTDGKISSFIEGDGGIEIISLNPSKK